MLRTVDVGHQRLDAYRSTAGDAAVEEVRKLAAGLRGLRVLHLSATPYGGGVAEILRSKIPLLRDIGLRADWELVTGGDPFFSATKAVHNALQGDRRGVTPAQWEVYLAESRHTAAALDNAYDVVVVHDPQPLAVPRFAGRGASRWVWRCHIDTSAPNPAVLEKLVPFVAEYDAVVYTMAAFAPPSLDGPRAVVIPPAIDPESPKNMAVGRHVSRRVLRWIGIELDRPLMVQVSRFDPWKDPAGVVAVYRRVRQNHPDLQLALVGSMALDDPEGWEVYRGIQALAAGDEGIHLFTNLTGVGNIEVNAFQREADVVVQKSLREGFGLVVSEALWKRTPVVAERAGGIPLQLSDGVGGFLVDGPEACAERVDYLLAHPQDADEIGAAGHDVVRDKFLLPRLIADELRLYADLVEGR